MSNKVFRIILFSFTLIFHASQTLAAVKIYKINIEYKKMNVTGRDIKVIALGKVGEPSHIPAPTLEFSEGDTARITFFNKLDQETSIHWHGLIVPNDQDGVPGLTTPAIKPGEKFTYEFPIRQSGTYWYHSHSGLQEQQGVYGAIVIHPKVEPLVYDREEVLVISDWTDRNPEEIEHILKTDPEWEQLRKNTLRNWGNDIKDKTLKERFKSEWNRMGPMDVADVSYDAFLINGHSTGTYNTVKPGEKIRLRVINASSSTYFRLGFGHQKMQVVAADGQPVSPIFVDDIPISTAETYDLIVTIPENKTVEFRATSEDVTGFASLFFGPGNEVEKARDFERPDPYSMSGSAKIISDDDDLIKLNYDFLRSLKPTTLPPENSTANFEFRVTGNMWRYVWSFNNKSLGPDDVIEIKKGQNVRFTFINQTMMHHPLHFHGHFFRVINAQGEYSPLKHTVDLAPMQTLVLEFYADQEKDWLFHCHLLPHMLNRMAFVVHYADGMPPMKTMQSMGMGDRWYTGANAFETNQRSEVDINSVNSKYDARFKGEYYYKDQDFKLRAEGAKHFTQYFDTYAGFQFDKDGRAISAGIEYKLPFLINARIGGGNRGLDYSLAKEFALKHNLSIELMWGREYGQREPRSFVRYRFKRFFSLEGGYAEKGLEGGFHFTK